MIRILLSGLIFFVIIISFSSSAFAGCTDSDEGMNYYAKGITKGPWASDITGPSDEKEDVCIGSSVKEYFCNVSDITDITSEFGIDEIIYNCPYGCEDGACLLGGFTRFEDKNPDFYCLTEDPDDDIYTKGRRIFFMEYKYTLILYQVPDIYLLPPIYRIRESVKDEDVCLIKNDEVFAGPDMWERRCHVDINNNLIPMSERIECKRGCRDGVCLKEPVCEDYDGGKDYYSKGIVTWGKDVSTDECQNDKTLIEFYCGANDVSLLDANNDITDGFYASEQWEQISVMSKQDDSPLWDDDLWDGESETFTSNKYFTLQADYEPFGRDYSGTSNYVYIVFYRNSNAAGTWPERTFDLTVDGKVITVYLPSITYTYPEHYEGANLLSFYVTEDGSTYYAKRDHQPTTNYGETNLSGSTYGYDPVEKLRFWYHLNMSMDMSPSEAFSPEHLARSSGGKIRKETFECPYMCENGACVKETEPETCSDGTSYNECSEDRPSYCEEGSLVDKCSECGCSSGYECKEDGGCEFIEVVVNETLPEVCSDGTIYDKCSEDKPLYCEEGSLVDKCSECGCSSGYECKEEGGCEFIEVNETEEWEEIKPGAEVSMNIDKTEMGVTKIEISVKNPANQVSITITKLEHKPAEIVKEVSGKVYQYLEVKKSNLEDTNIDKSKVEFKVEKTWISEKKIDKSKVNLNRYTTEWEKLPTIIVAEDKDYIHYEAETPSFSVFAITGEELACKLDSKRCVKKELQKCKSDGSWETVENCEYLCFRDKCFEPPKTIEIRGEKLFDLEEIGKSIDVIYIGVIVIIILIIVIFSFSRLERHSKPRKEKSKKE